MSPFTQPKNLPLLSFFVPERDKTTIHPDGWKIMRSEIKDIRAICKYGAFGDLAKFGTWIYGRRPGGRVLACKNHYTEDGGIKIWSGDNETEFSAKEWAKIRAANKALQPTICNEILMNRKQNT